MSFEGLVQSMVKGLKRIDLQELLRVAALQAVTTRTKSVMPWLIGGAIAGFGAGMVLGPRLIAAGKALTHQAGDTLVKLAGNAKEALDNVAGDEASEDTGEGGTKRGKKAQPHAKA